MVRRRVAQALRHWRGIDDRAGVEYTLRVKNVLDLPERLVDDGPEHLLVPLAAGHAVAVLARERAAELEDEIAHLPRDAAHAGYVVGVLQVEHRADVQATNRG